MRGGGRGATGCARGAAVARRRLIFLELPAAARSRMCTADEGEHRPCHAPWWALSPVVRAD